MHHKGAKNTKVFVKCRKSDGLMPVTPSECEGSKKDFSLRSK